MHNLYSKANTKMFQEEERNLPSALCTDLGHQIKDYLSQVLLKKKLEVSKCENIFPVPLNCM